MAQPSFTTITHTATVTFDGSTCRYDGPTSFESSDVAHVELVNTSPDAAHFRISSSQQQTLLYVGAPAGGSNEGYGQLLPGTNTSSCSALPSTGATQVPGPTLHGSASPDDPTEPQAPTSPTLAEADETAKGFLEAYGDFDADQAISYFADDSVVAMVGTTSGTPDEFRLELSLPEAIGYQHTINGCETQDDSTSDIHLRCTFDLHALRSDELGLGPYTDNYWDLTVRDGAIASAVSTWAYSTNGFGDQSWGPFSSWVVAQHSDDVPVMYDDRRADWRLTAESIRLWEQRTKEYAATNKRTD